MQKVMFRCFLVNSRDQMNIPKSGEGGAWRRSGSSGGLEDSSPDKSRSYLDTRSDNRQTNP